MKIDSYRKQFAIIGKRFDYIWTILVKFVFGNIQPNFNGSNNFGTMKICSRQGQFELMSANHGARPGDIIGIFF